jgi:hypothetical protein
VTVVKKLGFLLLFVVTATSCWSAEKIKSIRVAVENPSSAARPAADVVVSIPDLRNVAPDFAAGAVRVICTASADSKETTELPSQVDDLDGDGKADELAFQIDLAPHQTRVVTIQYGVPESILRIRQDYRDRTYALFSAKYEGLGWESENIAFRVYFDPRNAIDIYGKRRQSLQLRLYATPEYPYHEESPEGRDIFRVGEAIGIGAVAAWVDGKVVKAAEVKERTWRIVSTGPVRAIVEVGYGGWKLGDKTISVRSRIIMWAGEHGFYHTISVDPQASASFVTGLPVRQEIPPVKSIPAEKGSATWLATWGEEVLAPGATATKMVPGENLGLAILTANPQAEFAADQANNLLRFAPQNGDVTWYAMAAWDQENKTEKKSSIFKMSAAITNKEGFLALVKDQAVRMADPVKVQVTGEIGQSEWNTGRHAR